MDAIVQGDGDSTGALTPEQKDLQALFIGHGMPEEQIMTCLDLDARMAESEVLYESPDSEGVPEQVSQLFLARAELYLDHCEEFEARSNWSDCSVVGGPVIPMKAPSCDAQEQAYMQCLAKKSIEDLNECLQFERSAECMFPASSRDFASELACKGGRVVLPGGPAVGGVRGQGAGGQRMGEQELSSKEEAELIAWANTALAGPTDSIDGGPTTQSRGENYGFGVWMCEDGLSYSLSCAEPTSACWVTCVCRIDGRDVDTIELSEHVIDANFDAEVFDACGFSPRKNRGELFSGAPRGNPDSAKESSWQVQ